MHTALISALLSSLLCPHASAEEGGTTSTAVLTQYYPNYTAWPEAGARPSTNDVGPTISVSAGSDLQQVLHELAGPGRLVLADGAYQLTDTLRLGPGQSIHGSGPNTVLIYGEQAPQHAIVLDQADGAGLASLTIRYADPHRWADGDHLAPDTWINASGVEAPSVVAVSINQSTNCRLHAVRIEVSPGDAIHLDDARHCSLTDVTIDRALNRGTDSGRMIISNSHALHISGLEVIGLRRIEINGPVTDSVFADCSFGAGIEFRRQADLITGNLFERCSSVLPPGYPWLPYTTWLTPLGTGNLMLNGTAFHHGTDAVVPGVVAEPDVVYRLQPRRARPFFDPETSTIRKIRQIERHTSSSEASSALPDADHVLTASNTLPAGASTAPLRQRQQIRQWIGVLGLPPESWDRGIDDPSAMRGLADQIHGQSLTDVSLPEPAVPSAREILGGQLTTERLYGRVYPLQYLRAGQYDLLSALGGWNQVGILHQTWQIHDRCQFQVAVRNAGCEYRLFIAGTEVREDDTIRLDAGYYPVWVLVRAKRRAPMERKSLFALELRQIFPETRPGTTLNSPAPNEGMFLPPRQSSHIQRLQAATSAYQELFDYMRNDQVPGLRQRVDEVAREHPGTAAGYAAAVITQILETAPFDESNPDHLENSAQWGELSHYYHRMGLWLRHWRIDSAVPGSQDYEAYYSPLMDDYPWGFHLKAE